jgi:hypothetical protein
MKDITEGQLHKSLYDFMSDSKFEVKILNGPCDKDHAEVIEHFKQQGFEVFPYVMTTDHKECSIFLRKSKFSIPSNKSDNEN